MAIQRYQDPYTEEWGFRQMGDDGWETIDPNLVEEDTAGDGWRMKDPLTLGREQSRTQGILPLVDPGISQYNQQGGNFSTPQDFYSWLYGGGSVVNEPWGQGFQVPNYQGGEFSQYMVNDPSIYKWSDPSPGLSNPIVQAGLAAVLGGAAFGGAGGGAAAGGEAAAGGAAAGSTAPTLSQLGTVGGVNVSALPTLGSSLGASAPLSAGAAETALAGGAAGLSSAGLSAFGGAVPGAAGGLTSAGALSGITGGALESALGASLPFGSGVTTEPTTGGMDFPHEVFSADAAISAPGTETLGELSILGSPESAALAGGSAGIGNFLAEVPAAIGEGLSSLGGAGTVGGAGVTSPLFNALGALYNIYEQNQERGDFKDLQGQLQAATGQATYEDDPSAFLNSPLARAQLDELNRQLAARNAKLGKTFSIDPGTGRIRGSGTGFQDWTNQFQAAMGQQYQAEMERRRKKAGLESGAAIGAISPLAQLMQGENQARRNMVGGTIPYIGDIWSVGKSIMDWF